MANAGWVVGLNLVRQLIQLAFFAVLVRELSKTTVGEYQLITSAIGLCGFFILPGVSSMIMQSVARGHLGTFRKAFQFQLAGGVLGGIAICIYALLMEAQAEELRVGMMIAGIAFPLAYGLSGWTDFQAGQGRFRQNA